MVINLWKHQPNNYLSQTIEESNKNGIDVINLTDFGLIHQGIIICSMCKIGFDYPQELFIHLFHKHTSIKIISSKFIEFWPFSLNKLTVELQEIIIKISFQKACSILKELNIFSDNLNKCMECGNFFNSEEDLISHLKEKHIVLTFDPIPIPSFE